MDKRLITGFPRSGTEYMSKVMQKTGLRMGHEGHGDCSDGTVSYWHSYFKAPGIYEVVLHQIRDPLEVIPSAFKKLSEPTMNCLGKITRLGVVQHNRRR